MDYNFKIAAYVDEAGEDPNTGCETIVKHGIKHVVLRNVWGGLNVTKCSDDGCKRLKAILAENRLSVVSISSDLGATSVSGLLNISDTDLKRAFDIALYFRAGSIGFQYGRGLFSKQIVSKWLNRLLDYSNRNNIIPMLEVNNDSCLVEPTAIVDLLIGFDGIKIQYDPVQLIINKKIDPFIKYWSLFKNRIYAVDVRDCVVGKGFRPPGLGDAKIKETLADAKNSNYNGWLFIEPGLGRRFGSAVCKSDTFEIAFAAAKNLMCNVKN